MINKRNIILSIFFLIYFIIGTYLSLTNGISHDQLHEQLNWSINFQAIKDFFTDNNGYQLLQNYIDRYHGIGFHFFSQPFQFFLNNFVQEINSVNKEGAIYISRHFPTFLIFCIAGYFFYLICFKISKNFNFSIVSLLIFFLYPYLFGHSQINGKDIPFLSVWIITTYFLFNIVEKFYFEKKIVFSEIILFAFLTGFLISIRTIGFLIFFEYLIALIILINSKKLEFFTFLFKNKSYLLIFSLAFLFFIYILNPIFWLNPFEFINSLQWMSKYHNSTCTLTLGKCLKAQNLPNSYIFIWLFFKLPILSILGILSFPLVEKKLFKNDVNSIFYSTLLLTFLLIIFTLILKNVVLYDEIRHLMFLLPLILIISFYNLFLFNKKIFNVLSVVTIILFISENFFLKKYQYTWLNHFAKFTNIEKNFEIDYWGLSNKNLQKKIINFSENKNISKNTCVYGDLYVEAFLRKANFNCFGSYSQIDAVKKRPFFVYQNVRNLKRSSPKSCKLIHTEKYNYLFYSRDITVGKVWFCE